MKAYGRAPRTRLTRVTCLVCEKTVGGYVPMDGDGSGLRVRWHKGTDGEPCAGRFDVLVPTGDGDGGMERGTVMPWMLASALFVLAFVGMSLDLARIVAADRQTSTAVDAAAAAGASGIDEAAYRADGTVRLDPPRARALVLDNLAANPDAARLEDIDIVVTADTVTVSATEPVVMSPPMRLLSALELHRVQAMSNATVRRS